MSITEVETQLGPAPKSETVEDGEYSYRCHKYLKGAVLLFFDQDKESRLSSIEVDEGSEVSLFGVPLFRRTRAQVLDLLRQHLSDEAFATIKEERDEPIEEITVNVAALGMTFCFSLDEILRQVYWGLLFDSNDEVIWPPYTAEERSRDAATRQRPKRVAAGRLETEN